MKKTFAVLALVLPLGVAFAQTRSAEAYPVTNSKPQAAAEARKSAKPSGVAPIKDGSTADGQGSGVDKVSGTERVATQRQAQREARPHRETTQGGTPK